MAYTNLINDIQAVIKNNGNQEITGQVLQTALVEMVNELGSGYTYKGVATLSTTPDVTTPNIFYLLGEVGTYTNIGGIQHTSGIGIALWNGTAWSYQNVPSNAVVPTDATPTENSTNPVQSGGVWDATNSYIEVTDYTSQAGLLKNNGTIDTTTVPSATFKKFNLISGVSEYLISGNFLLTSGYSAAWMVDDSGNMLSYLTAGFNETLEREKIVVPSGATEIWVWNRGTLEYGKSIKDDIADIEDDIADIKNDIETRKALAADSQGVGYIKNDGTITNSPGGGLYNIFNIPTGVTRFLLSYPSITLTPNQGWSLVWIVDANGNMLNYISLTNQYVPSADDVVIDTTDFPTATKIYITKIPSFVLEYITNEPINKAVANLDNRVTELEQEEDLSNRNQWKNKKIIWLGTSIPYGQSAEDGGRAAHPYPNQIAEKLDCTVENNCSPGLAIEGIYESGVWTPKTSGSLSLTLAEYASAGQSSPGVKCYENSMLGKNADLYVFDCEPNNTDASLTDLENFSIAQWKYNDNSSFASHRNTYIGALIYLIDKLLTEKPNAKIVLIGEYGNVVNYQEYNIRLASIALCEKFRIKYIDLWNKLYYNPLNKSQYINDDNVHPKQAGYDRIANILSNELLLIS